MKLFDELDDENFFLYAAKHYYNPTCIDAEEFYEDIKRFKYIKRLITRYRENGKLSTNLLLNHTVIILNVFGIEAGIKMLEFKIGMQHWHIIKPLLIYLRAIESDKYIGISMDEKIVEELRKI